MTTNAEQWTPPTGSQATASPTGTWWDAVRVPSAAAWNLYRVHVLGAVEGVATYLGVPPVDRLARPGSHWRVPFTRDGYLTDPRLLYKALIRALLAAASDGRSDGR
ncbi:MULTISPECIES: hypothetical protein [Streptomyces]|uniref:hypothetical protein n=1 Tax=Streptomyces lycopersici TaxID=2974589 RepID=UPI0021D10F63|nr:hypothetical protein [Streptomyces sp. NEAU-383]